MRVTLNAKNVYAFDYPTDNPKVIAEEFTNGRVLVKTSELLRIGIPMFEIGERADTVWVFERDEYEIVQTEFINCSDSNVGKGWEGFYDQKPIKKSKFRNH